MRKLLTICITVVLALVLVACGNGGDSKKITVGAKGFTEQFIFGKLTTLMLEENGFTEDEKNNLGSTALRQDLENKQVDIVWDDTGNGLARYIGQDRIQERNESVKTLKQTEQSKTSTSTQKL